MKELLTRHWLSKLLSLLLAIGIWFLVNDRIKSGGSSDTNIKRAPADSISR